MSVHGTPAVRGVFVLKRGKIFNVSSLKKKAYVKNSQMSSIYRFSSQMMVNFESTLNGISPSTLIFTN